MTRDRRPDGDIGGHGGRAAFWPSPRPRALFLGVLAWIAFSLVVSVLLAPPVYAALSELVVDPPHFRRVTRRVVQAAALAFAFFALFRLGVRRPRDFGYGLAPDSAPRFLRNALGGFAFAAAMIAFDFATGARQWQAAPDPGYVALGIVGIVLLAFVEEACFRGALLFPFGRLEGVVLAGAATMTSALFATVHFVRGGMRGSGADLSAALAVWGAVPQAVGEHFEAWVGLFAIGLAFDFVARRQGDAWGVTGLHLGAGLALQVAGRTSDLAPGARSPFFVEGLLPGYGFVVALAMVAAALAASRRPAGRPAASTEGELSPASVSRERGRPSRAR